MSEIYKVCGAAIIALTLTAVLKSHGSSLSPYLTQISAIVILISTISALIPIVSFINSLIKGTSSAKANVQIILTASAIALMCKTVSDLCKENGENMLKNAVEFAGNAQIILLALPMIKELLTKSMEVLKL